MRLLNLFFVLLLPGVIFCQENSLHPEMDKKLRNWYEQTGKNMQFDIKDSTYAVSVEGHVIHWEYDKMHFNLYFKRSLSKISTHVDSLRKYFLRLDMVGGLQHGIDAPAWNIHLRPGIRDEDKDEIKFIDRGEGRLSMQFILKSSILIAYKNTADCEMIHDAPTPKECYTSLNELMHFHFNVELGIEPIKAVVAKSYPSYLQFERKQQVSLLDNHTIADGDAKNGVLTYNYLPNQIGFCYQDTAQKLLWKNKSKRKSGRNSSFLGAKQDLKGDIYAFIRSYPSERISIYKPLVWKYKILKWNKKGRLKKKIVHRNKFSGSDHRSLDDFEVFKDFFLDKNENILLFGKGILMYSKRGRLLWKFDFPENKTTIHQVVDYQDGYLAVGKAKSQKNKGMDAVLYYFNKKGELLATHYYGGDGEDFAEAIYPKEDGSCIIGGGTSSKNGDVKGLKGTKNIWIFKLNANFEIEWQQCLGSSQVVYESYNYTLVRSIYETANGKLLILAHNEGDDVEVTDLGNLDVYVALLNAQGKLEWQQAVGSVNYDYLISSQFENGRLFLNINNAILEYKLPD